jgi:integrase
MPDGACVIAYRGKRGVTWYVKFRDATGKQVKERLGRATDGWNKRKAEAALRARLVAVDRDRWTKPERETFAKIAEDWIVSYPVTEGLKRSTRLAYEGIIHGHLIPAFGTLDIGELTVERIERYLASKARDGYSAASRNRQLNVLSLILKSAVRRHLIPVNPVASIKRPREPKRAWRILSPAEVVAIERSFDELIREAEEARERDDLVVVRRLFLLHAATGLRQGEAAGLRWKRVYLADPAGAYLRVEETWSNGWADTPKSEAGKRTLDLGRKLAEELFEHRAWSAFDGDEDLVLPNPRTGRPLDQGRLSELMKTARLRAGIEDYVRPTHDLRHTSLTNAARAGASDVALMARAGHSSFATTQLYISLAGARFQDEAERLENRLWGETGTKNRYEDDGSEPVEVG